MTFVTLHNKEILADKLVWEEPPAQEKSGKYSAIVAALKENPGRFAIIQTFPASEKSKASGVALRINKKIPVDFRDQSGEFEAVVRTSGDVSRLYVKYNKEN